jgi:hypothetical protein
VGALYEYRAKASDEDDDSLSFSLVDTPAGMVIDDASGRVRWTPAAPGNFTIKIKVEDGRGGESIQEFTLTVADKVRLKPEISKPAENEKVRGTVVFSGNVVKGTLGVLSVEVRIDGGVWLNATGAYAWQFSLDTTKLKNGKHLLEARAFDGKDYSDLAAVNFTVDNQKAQGKGFIPGFTGGVVLLAVIPGAVLLFWRKRL